MQAARDSWSTTYGHHRWLTYCVDPKLLRALTEAFALPGGTREFSLQVTDLAQGWSDTVSAEFHPHRPPGHGSKRLHPCQAAPCSKARAPSHVASTLGCFCSVDAHAFPALQEERVIHQESFLPQQLGFSVEIRTPSEWIEICWEDSHSCNKSLGQCFAAAHVDSCSFSLTSEASQVALAAWLVSVLDSDTRHLQNRCLRRISHFCRTFHVCHHLTPQLLPRTIRTQSIFASKTLW